MKDEQHLPAAIATYIAATNNQDTAQFLSTFTEDALVHDEGKDYRGHEALRAWRNKSAGLYEFSLEFIRVTTNNESYAVDMKCTGTFPGSPIVLKHYFELRDNKVRRLEIKG